jgi:hypothetical protein
MKRGIIDSIKEDWLSLTCQFEYWSHLKGIYVLWHLIAFIASLLASPFLPLLGAGCILCLISWNYFVLFDRRRRGYKDGYLPKRYEIIGTIWATIVLGIVIVGFLFPSYDASKTP